MSTSEQKNIEREDVLGFLTSQKINFLKLVSPISDPPDVVVFGEDSEEIAIEHTVINNHKGNSLRKEKEAMKSILTLAEEIYQKLCLPNVSVSVRKKSKPDISKGKLNEVSHQLVELVASSIPEEDEFDLSKKCVPKDELPDYLQEIRILRGRKITRTSFAQSGYYRSTSMDVEKELFPSISKKNLLLSNQGVFQKYRRVWLLLIIENQEWSDFASVSVTENKCVLENNFEKIYTYSRITQEVIRIK